MLQNFVKDKDLIQEVKNLYYSSKLDECISLVSQKANIPNAQEYLIIHLYKSLSYFEKGLHKNAFQSFEMLISVLNEVNKCNQLAKQEIIIRSFYQWLIFNDNEDEAVMKNTEFKLILDQYQEAFSNQQIYNQGVYFFGLGIYEIIELYNQDEVDIAINLLIKAKNQLKEYEWDLIAMISWAYYTVRKYNESLECINELFAINPNFPSILSYIATYFYSLNRLEEAEIYYLKALEYQPKNIIFLNNLASFYFQNKQNEKALQYAQTSFDIDKENSDISIVYGEILTELNQLQKAKDILVNSILFNPNYADLHQQLAEVEKKLNNEEEYLKNLQQCIKINPKQSTYYFNLGYAQFYCGLNTEALETFSQSIKLKQSLQSSFLIYFWLGQTYLKLFQFSNALENFFSSLDLNLPSNKQLKYILFIRKLLTSQKLSESIKIEKINQMGIYSLQKLSVLINTMKENSIKEFLKYKLAEHTQLLSTLCYKLHLEEQLSFQGQIQHWDLSID